MVDEEYGVGCERIRRVRIKDEKGGICLWKRM
jgi:hypothetical protein